MMQGSNRRFSDRGVDQAALLAEMDEFRRKDRRWNELKNLRAAYDAGDDVTAVVNAADDRRAAREARRAARENR